MPVFGHRWWIIIWYGILILGIVGFLAAMYWGRQTRWRNLDEILRAIGTITVSLGMLLFLYRVGGGAAETLLLAALLSFVLAFVIGRRPERGPPPEDGGNEGAGPE
jgi:hypothetical protein